jgi:hypothetical protein
MNKISSLFLAVIITTTLSFAGISDAEAKRFVNPIPERLPAQLKERPISSKLTTKTSPLDKACLSAVVSWAYWVAWH